MPSCQIICGDALTELRKLPAESVQCCVTSPPYWGLRDYGIAGQLGNEKTPQEYVDRLTEIFREVRRVLREDGTVWLNLGDSYANDGKWGGASGGKHISELHSQTGIGRGKKQTGLKSKDLIGIPWRVAFALQADGWWLRSDIIWAKPNCMPESVTDRPTRSHEYIFLLTKAARYYYDADAIKEPAEGWRGSEFHDGKNLINHPSVGKNRKQDGHGRRHAGFNARWDAMEATGKWSTEDPQSSGKRITDGVKRARANGGEHDSPFGSMRSKRDVWTVCPANYPEAHFATYPPALIQPCILAGSRPSDTVLDPFAGSGTTGQVALELGRSTVLIELNPAYCELIRQRTNITPGLPLSREDGA